MNTPLQKAARALIERWDSPYWKHAPTADYIDELRKALAAEIAQSVEPVAWMDPDTRGIFYYEYMEAEYVKNFTVPLYLHPPQSQATTPRKPLTDDQVINAMREDGCERIESFYFAGPVQKAAVWSFARAIEAALLKAQGEKP